MATKIKKKPAKTAKTKSSAAKKPFPTVNIEEVNNLRMVCENENKFRKVIHGGQLKEWVGIGWIVIKEKPDYLDRKHYPTVVDAKGKPL